MNDENAETRMIKITVNGQLVLPVSQHVLVANSAYFEAIFQPQHSGFAEKGADTLDLKDFDRKCLKILLSQLKSSPEETELAWISSTTCTGVFYLCVRLLMKFDYETIAMEALTSRNCHDYLVAAESTASPRLLRAAHSKMLNGFLDFRRTRSFKRLPKDDLVSYLRNRHLVFNFQKEIFEAILWWIKFDFDGRISIFKDLMALVEWCLVPPKTYDFVKCLPTVQRSPEWLEMINDLHKLKIGSANTVSEIAKVSFGKSRKNRPLVLLIESAVSTKTDNKSQAHFFTFYNVETEEFLDDCVYVEDFPEGCAVAFYDGNLIIFGGIYGITTSRWNYEIKAYNIFTKRWRVIGRLDKPRRHFEMVQTGNKFYLLGGTTTFRLPTTSMDVFDYAHGTVQSCANMVFKMNYPFACCWSGSNLYIFDGSNSSCPIYSYNPRSNDWMVHLPFVNVIYEKLRVALSCGGYVYLTGFDCPVLLRKSVKQLRETKIDTSRTLINDSELTSQDVTILGFFVHYKCIYAFYETEKKGDFGMNCFDTLSTEKSVKLLPDFYEKLTNVAKSIPGQKIGPLKILKAKNVGSTWIYKN